jgi:predicted nucleic acid-binding protein
MIVVDTSVWIDYFNNVVSPHSNTLDVALVEGNVAIGDIIFLEILQGFRSDKDYKSTKTQLLKLDQHEMFGHQMVVLCANNYRSLRKKGITIRSTTDVLIATFCIENNLSLLFKDKDFIPFTKHLGLLSDVV